MNIRRLNRGSRPITGRAAPLYPAGPKSDDRVDLAPPLPSAGGALEPRLPHGEPTTSQLPLGVSAVT